jgi:hypothetical protein
MKSARIVYVVLFAAATFASAAQLAAALAGPSFAASVFYNFTGQPGQVVTADLNGDGKLDVLMPVQCTPSCLDGAVTVLLGNGDGTFQTAHNYATGGPAHSVVVTDVNGDGKPDLLVPDQCINVNTLCSAVSVLLGNGDGTFQAAVNYATGGYSPFAMAVGDVNRDGRPDLVVVNSCVSTTNCSNSILGVLLGNGDGTFQAAVPYSGAPSTLQVALVDVNGDGKLDLVGASSAGTVGCCWGTVMERFKRQCPTAWISTRESRLRT